ncbi:hypothetical protein TNCV_3935711 [Trichonephila clavipes]|nr:hypothetical protein TNCV_3935711 [Trichonephila clavipes]
MLITLPPQRFDCSLTIVSDSTQFQSLRNTVKTVMLSLVYILRPSINGVITYIMANSDYGMTLILAIESLRAGLTTHRSHTLLLAPLRLTVGCVLYLTL